MRSSTPLAGLRYHGPRWPHFHSVPDRTGTLEIQLELHLLPAIRAADDVAALAGLDAVLGCVSPKSAEVDPAADASTLSSNAGNGECGLCSIIRRATSAGEYS